MLVSLFSGLFGLLSGSAPKIVDYFEKRQELAHEIQIRKMEMEFRERDHKLALERISAEASVKMDEHYWETVDQELKSSEARMVALYQQSALPTGVRWLDVLNAAIRPMVAVFTMVIFFGTLIAWSAGAPVNAAFGAQMGVIFGELTMGFIYFYLGYRSIPKPRS